VRILFVNEKCGYYGGVEQNVAATVVGLRSMGHRCFLAYGTATDRDFYRYGSLFEEVFLCRDICFPEKQTTAQNFQDIVKIVSPDVLYLHKLSKMVFCMPFLGKIRTVRMVHDHDLCCPRRHKYFFHNGRVCHVEAGWRCYLDLAFLERGAGSRRTLNFVSIQDKLSEMRRNYNLDRFLVGSRFMRDELLQNGFPEAKVSILPPIVPLKAETVSPVSDEPIILCVAQLIRGKGIDLLLRALQRMSVDFRAIIVGAGNAEHDLRALCHTLQLEEKVHFKGWVSNDRIGEFYSKARVVAVPCRWPEPFGMIGLEAMHHGRPVVAFAVGGISDWLENEVTGLLAAEQDVKAFAKALETLMVDRELAQTLGERGLSRVQERFSFEDYLHQTVQHLGGSSVNKKYASDVP
jgi:glycosyltransferase involved in cell wall biosynthesis